MLRRPGNKMLHYPARLIPDGEGFSVHFHDIPEALTCGRSREEAGKMAADALITALNSYLKDKRRIPQPSKLTPGDVLIDLPHGTAAKVLFLNACLDRDLSRAEKTKIKGRKGL